MQSTTSTPRFLNIVEFKDYVQVLIDNQHDNCFQQDLNVMKAIHNGRAGWEERKRVLEQAGYTKRREMRDWEASWDWAEEGKIYFVLNEAYDPYIITIHPSPDYPHYIWYVELSPQGSLGLPSPEYSIRNYNHWRGDMWVSWSKELICGDRIPFLNWYMESPFGVKV